MFFSTYKLYISYSFIFIITQIMCLIYHLQQKLTNEGKNNNSNGHKTFSRSINILMVNIISILCTYEYISQSTLINSVELSIIFLH